MFRIYVKFDVIDVWNGCNWFDDIYMYYMCFISLIWIKMCVDVYWSYLGILMGSGVWIVENFVWIDKDCIV